MRLVLASASPRRAGLLRAAGFTFETCPVDIDEAARAGETPAIYVRRLAAEKSARGSVAVHGSARNDGPAGATGPAKAGHYVQDTGPMEEIVQKKIVQEKVAIVAQEDIVVLGADTAVVVDGDIVAKPRDPSEAAAMLHRLSGRRHEVMTGVSLRMRGFEIGRVETTVVYFAPLSVAEIAWYVASGEGLDKAGAYGIQGLASRFIPRIEGSYSNVVGLPLHCVYELLNELGVGYPLPIIRSRKSL
jgi:septum formation protein